MIVLIRQKSFKLLFFMFHKFYYPEVLMETQDGSFIVGPLTATFPDIKSQNKT